MSKNKKPTEEVIETRALGDVAAGEGERSLSGYAHRYGNLYDMKVWTLDENWEWVQITIREVFEKGAFDYAKIERAYFRHNHNMQACGLAHRRNKTLLIKPDENGLYYEANLSDTQAGKDLYTNVRSGLINEMSFAYTVDEEDEESVIYTRINEDLIERRIMKVEEIYDVSTVDYPAFDGTSVESKGLETGDVKPVHKRNSMPGLQKFLTRENDKEQSMDFEKDKLLTLIDLNL